MKITLCGSTQYKKEFEEENLRLTLEGHIVYSVAVCGHADGIDHTQAEKAQLDAVHLLKIMDSDTIFVINYGGYIGESTEREIAFAGFLGKTILYLEPSNAR